MRAFLETVDGLVSHNDVRRIIRSDGGAVVELRDGSKAELVLSYEALALTSLGVVPAAPGWFALTIEDDQATYSREGVIAWGIGGIEGMATPITAEGGLVMWGHLVEDPTGQVCAHLEGSYASLKEWALAAATNDDAALVEKTKGRAPQAPIVRARMAAEAETVGGRVEPL
jgi:hypothetical protein